MFALGDEDKLLHFAGQAGPVSWATHQAPTAQVRPHLPVESSIASILAPSLHGRGVSSVDLLIGLMGIEECTAVGCILVDGALALKEPVTGTIGLPGRYQGGVRVVRQGPQMLLSPDEHIRELPLGTQPKQIRRVQGARDVPTGCPAKFTGTDRPGKAMFRPRARLLVTRVHDSLFSVGLQKSAGQSGILQRR